MSFSTLAVGGIPTRAQERKLRGYEILSITTEWNGKTKSSSDQRE